jgi:alpha-beta hydrolase superfamily lysophospholipase
MLILEEIVVVWVRSLADYAVIVLHVKELYNTSNPVYCFGGSYGGLLSALLRIKYGNVFWGSVASAAPLFANRADPENWFRLVSFSYLDHGA